MPEMMFQILEVRAADTSRPPTITAAVSSDAMTAIHTALSEQLDRRRQEPIENPEAVAELRDAITLVERFATLSAAGAHAVVSISQDELHACLMGLTQYVDRVDGEHFQPAELRDRLQVIAGVVSAMWDANAAVAEAAQAVVPLIAGRR